MQKEFKLNMNENLEPLPGDLLLYIQKKLAGISFYPSQQACDVLISNISRYYTIKKENIVLTNGGYHAIDIIMNMLLEKNDVLSLPIPNFPFYEKYSLYKKIKISKVVCNNLFEFNIDKIISSLSKKTKIVYISNPNNPTGYLFQEKELVKLIKVCILNNTNIVIDEAYFDFSGVTVKDYVRKYKNLFIIRTFSKSLSLAGLKLGYIITQKANIRKIEQMRGPIYALSNLAVIAANHFLEHKKVFARRIKLILNHKKSFESSLIRSGYKVYSSKANFTFVKVHDNLLKALRRKENKHILLLDLSSYPDSHSLLKNHLRITIGTNKQMNQLASLFKKYEE